MPRQSTIKRARKDKKEGKAPSTQAGEFVREVIDDIREGKHGARSTKQAIAIGLSMARRAGVKLPPPEKGKTSEKARKQAKRELKRAEHGPVKPSPKRARASRRALEKEGHEAATPTALSRQTKKAAKKRTAKERSVAAKKAARTRARR